jgi:hypothetical protein
MSKSHVAQSALRERDPFYFHRGSVQRQGHVAVRQFDLHEFRSGRLTLREHL